MLTLVEVLVNARALIEHEEDWCPNGPGHLHNGRFTTRCAITALNTAASEFTYTYSLLFDEAYGLMQRLAGGTISYYNDRHTHAEVLALFDRAIAEARLEEQA